MKKYTTYFKKEDTPEKWWLVDAEGAVLGRLASQIAAQLRGKNNPMYTPNADTGDFVVVVNAEKIVLTGRKLDDKKYYHHTGWIGGIKEINAKDLLIKRPEDVIRFAVKGMLPKNRLGRQLIKKLKVYAGTEHPHEAQCPEKLDFNC